MGNHRETKDCPFCGEQILRIAKKCKHCGEWLDSSTVRTGSPASKRGSFDARAVTKGLKEKEFQDQTFGYGVFFGLIAAIVAGCWLGATFDSSAVGWTVGITIFIVVLLLLGKWYWKE